MEHLAQYVEDLGGGFLLTGGERSFGVGGYFKSPLDSLLPVRWNCGTSTARIA